MLISLLLAQILLFSTIFAFPTSNARLEQRLAARRASRRTLPLQRAVNDTTSTCVGHCNAEHGVYSNNWAGIVVSDVEVRCLSTTGDLAQHDAYTVHMGNRVRNFCRPRAVEPTGHIGRHVRRFSLGRY
jgi:hypothetical protein